MTIKKSASILLLLLLTLQGMAQSKYRIEATAPPAKLINGVAVGADGLGFVMKASGAKSTNMEVMARLNMLEKYFPVVELGVGECDKVGEEIGTGYKTSAPFFRIGCDYNLTKKRNGNRLFIGMRYGLCNLSYDYWNDELTDPYWESSMVGTKISGVKSTNQWIELCMGVETKLWKYFRMGWSLRYKSRVTQSNTTHGEPWYVPGYGKNTGTTFGALVNIIFEWQRNEALNFGKTKTKKK